MDRKEFIKQCGLACLGGAAMMSLLQSCGVSKTMSGSIAGDDLLVSINDFKTGKDDHFRKYVIVQNELLKYPICVFRHGDNEYTALLMRCTHQGAELQAFGDRLQCPAHGSEFDSRGNVQNGPASESLRKLPVRIDNDQLKISLKK